MRLVIHSIIVVVLSCVCIHVSAQQQQRNKAILEELNSIVPGKGRVTVYEDEAIKDILGRPMAPTRTVYTTSDGSMQYVKMRGFKIQAFAGNNQRTSKNEAYHKQDLINTAFPDQETAVLFDSPFWRLRVGNFQTREEADGVMQEMVRAFPGFGKEMYIVIDEVKIPVDRLQ